MEKLYMYTAQQLTAKLNLHIVWLFHGVIDDKLSNMFIININNTD